MKKMKITAAILGFVAILIMSLLAFGVYSVSLQLDSIRAQGESEGANIDDMRIRLAENQQEIARKIDIKIQYAF